MATITIVSAGFGGGHDGFARAMASEFRVEGHRVVTLDLLAVFPAHAGTLLKQAYRLELRLLPATWGWLVDLAARRRASTQIRRMLRPLASRLAAVIPTQTSLVLSTHPFATQALAQLRRDGRLQTPLVTYVTDASVHPLWIAEGVDLYLTSYPATAAEVRNAEWAPVVAVRPATSPRFRPARDADEVRQLRRAIGLPLDARLALVVSGSWGVGRLAAIAREIARSGWAVPVVVCGRNRSVLRRLRALDPGVALGWVDDMPSLMRACDLTVSCSGGLTIAEALATGTQIVIYRPPAGHARADADLLDRTGLVRWARSPEELTPILAGAASLPPGIPRLVGDASLISTVGVL